MKIYVVLHTFAEPGGVVRGIHVTLDGAVECAKTYMMRLKGWHWIKNPTVNHWRMEDIETGRILEEILVLGHEVQR
jgi:hypothetical protein